MTDRCDDPYITNGNTETQGNNNILNNNTIKSVMG